MFYTDPHFQTYFLFVFLCSQFLMLSFVGIMYCLDERPFYTYYYSSLTKFMFFRIVALLFIIFAFDYNFSFSSNLTFLGLSFEKLVSYSYSFSLNYELTLLITSLPLWCFLLCLIDTFLIVPNLQNSKLVTLFLYV